MESQFKPYSLSQIFSLTGEFFKSYTPQILSIALPILIPIQILLFFLSKSQSTPPEIGFAVFIVLVLNALSWVFLSLCISIFVSEVAVQNSVTVPQIFEKAMSKLFPALITSFLSFFFIFCLSLLLVIPGIIFSVFWAFVMQSVAIRGKVGMEALSYSKSLVTGRWWNTFGYFLVLGLIFILFSIVIMLPIQLMGSSINIIQPLVSIVMSIVGVVFSTVFFLVYEQSLPARTA